VAVTFHSIPQTYAPSDNPLSYVFSSDQTGQANFSYKIETILNGSVVSEDQVFPQTGIRSQFDCSPVVTNLMQPPRITSAISTNMDTIYTLVLRVTEVYGTTPTAQANASSTSIYTFKACLPSNEWEAVDFQSDYLSLKWLTDVPDNTFRVFRGQDVIAGMLVGSSQSLVVRFYDSSGIPLGSYSNANFYRYWQVNLSSDNLSAVYAGVGTYADVAYFTAEIGLSEVLTFIYVDQYCNDINGIVWLNKYGTFDQYPIEHYVSSQSDVQKRSFKRRYGRWSGTSFVYDHTNSGDFDFEKVITDKGKLVTNYMTDTTQNWFIQAYDSPQIYLYSVDGLEFRLNLTGTSYEKKNGRFDELIMEEMSYTKTMNRKSIKL